MSKRIFFSILFIPAIAAAIYTDLLRGFFFFLMILAVTVFTARETCILVERIPGLPCPRYIVLVSSLAVVFSYINGFLGVNGGTILCILGCGAFLFIAGLIHGKPEGLVGILIFEAVFIYTGVFPLFLYLTRIEENGAALVFFLLTLGWFNDASAYFIGSAFGRKRGIVRSSPNKSLEGYVSSFVLTVAGAALFGLACREVFPLGGGGRYGIVEAVLGGLLIGFAAPAGDLLESYFKRKANVKDSGAFLPGFGGVLDIFDSILLCAPLFYIYVKIMS